MTVMYGMRLADCCVACKTSIKQPFLFHNRYTKLSIIAKNKPRRKKIYRVCQKKGPTGVNL